MQLAKVLKTRIEEHAKAYPTDIFPDDSRSPEGYGAKMGRHMCHVFLKYIEDALMEIELEDRLTRKVSDEGQKSSG